MYNSTKKDKFVKFIKIWLVVVHNSEILQDLYGVDIPQIKKSTLFLIFSKKRLKRRPLDILIILP